MAERKPRQQIVFAAALALVCAFGFPLAHAAPAGPEMPEPGVHAAVSRIGGTAAHVRVLAVQEAESGSDTLQITVRVDPGYHVNANLPSLDYLIPTSVAFTGTPPAQIIYPPATRFKPQFAEEALDVYEGTFVIAAIFSPGVLGRLCRLDFTVTAQACTDQICLPPADLPGHTSW